MNTKVINNYTRLKPSLFLIPIVLLILIGFFLYYKNALNVENYIGIQKNLFLYLNHNLGRFPVLQYNLTQLGDASISFSFLIVLIVFTPKLWESLFSASLVSLIFSFILKNLFKVPRPATFLKSDDFIIIGKKAIGFASLPSGHSMTAFATITVLLFAFMPKNKINKIMWIILLILFGFSIAFSRVGVGAHYPLDVTIGSIIGFTAGLLGIFISQKYKICNWMNTKKCYPLFMVFIIVCSVTIILKLINENLIVYYFALISLFVSLYKISYAYIKK